MVKSDCKELLQGFLEGEKHIALVTKQVQAMKKEIQDEMTVLVKKEVERANKKRKEEHLTENENLKSAIKALKGNTLGKRKLP